ncbi:hypothetical protein CCR75_002239 [Bremia lactucae]|uniref:Uncharacterized protein n=1 Tax=Bremia lactucae TaxID=4779 RepID=A0A976FP92_BRELC|nr:hypothetical protein CCR75_002239 [Bremia lactucae]
MQKDSLPSISVDDMRAVACSARCAAVAAIVFVTSVAGLYAPVPPAIDGKSVTSLPASLAIKAERDWAFILKPSPSSSSSFHRPPVAPLSSIPPGPRFPPRIAFSFTGPRRK